MTPGVLPTTSGGRGAAPSAGTSAGTSTRGSGVGTGAGDAGTNVPGAASNPDVVVDDPAGFVGRVGGADDAAVDAERERARAGRPPRARAASARSSFEVVTDS